MIEVQTFCPEVFMIFSNLDIVPIFSSSYHHSSNLAGRSVRTVKNIMKNCTDKKLENAWRIGLIEYLCTPISNELPSPTEILNLHIYKGYQPFLCSSSRSESVTDKLVERKK